MQNAIASNETDDNLAILIDMGFSEEQSKQVKIKLILYYSYRKTKKEMKLSRRYIEQEI